MIALHLRWGNAPPPRDRFSQTLSSARHTLARSVTIGNAVLAISTLGDTPAASAVKLRDGSALLFDGHLDDRAALARSLGVHAADDATLYGEAYLKHQDEVDARICGQYAALIVAPSGQMVKLARSPLRAPPLHYWQSDDELIVGSAPSLLFATGRVPRVLDDQKIADSLVLNYNEERRSWFDGIRRVPIGTICHFSRGWEQSRRFHDLASLPPTLLGSVGEYVEQGRAMLEDAVRSSLGGFTRPAISLSGGLDSQAVAAFTAEALPVGGQIKGFTSIPDSPVSSDALTNELPYAKALGRMYPQLDVEGVLSGELWFDYRLDEIFEFAGVVPRNAANLHWNHRIWEKASTEGHDVIFTGSAGNLGFSLDGLWGFGEWVRTGQWGRLLRETRLAKAPGQSLLRALYARVVAPRLPEPAWSAMQKLAGRQHADPFATWSPIDPKWAKEMDVADRAEAMGHDMLFRFPSEVSAYRRDFGGGEAGDIDQAFLQIHGMPERDPLAYRPLVEFCHSIPVEQFIEGGETRLLARRILTGKVPEEVRTEQRRGVQASDWRQRLAREKAALSRELADLQRDEAITGRIAIADLKRTLDSWDNSAPADPVVDSRLSLAMPRAIATARFIRWAGRSEAPAPTD